MTLRPDELALQGDMNRSKEVNRSIGKGISTAIGAGAGALGASLGSKIMPFLSEYIPSGLALKGIQKVAPKFGDMLRKGMEQGLDVKEGLNYLKDTIANQDKKNIIQKHSPDLYEILKHNIKTNGMTPERAAIQASNLNDQFFKTVKEIEKETGRKWADIVSQIFSGKNAELKRNTKPEKTNEQYQSAFENDTQKMPMQAQPQQQSGGNEALMAAINKIMSM